MGAVVVTEIVIPQTSGGVGLRICRPERSPSGEVEYFTVEVSDPTIRATARVYAYQAIGLAELFDTMAREWRGWSGALEWHALEGDFSLECRADGIGHVQIEVLLSEQPGNSGRWQVRVVAQTEAGQLDALAKSGRRLFSRDESVD